MILSQIFLRLLGKGGHLLLYVLICLTVFSSGALAQSNENGMQVWLYGDEESDDGVNLDSLVLSNGNLLLCAFKMRLRAGQKGGIPASQAWLTCLRPDGSVAWEQLLGEDDKESSVIYPLELKDGRIAVMFSSAYQQNQLYQSVKYFSLDGAFLSENEIEITYVHIVPAGHGYMRPLVSGDAFPETYFTTPEGEPLWRLSDGIGCGSAVVTSDGLLLAGYEILGPDTYLWKLAMVSHKGEVLWKYELSEYQNVFLGNIIQTSDGGFLSAGAEPYPSYGSVAADSRSYLFKWNSRGDLEWVQSYLFAGNEGKFTSVAETERGYVAMYSNETYTVLDFFLTDKQGNELGRNLVSYNVGGVMLTPRLVTFGGDAWVYIGVIKENRKGDIMVMKLNADRLFEEVQLSP